MNEPEKGRAQMRRWIMDGWMSFENMTVKSGYKNVQQVIWSSS